MYFNLEKMEVLFVLWIVSMNMKDELEWNDLVFNRHKSSEYLLQSKARISINSSFSHHSLNHFSMDEVHWNGTDIISHSKAIYFLSASCIGSGFFVI